MTPRTAPVEPTTLRPLAFSAWRAHATAAGCLGRHYDAGGDTRLACLRFDPSPAADRLWELLLSEEDRLAADRRTGRKIVGTMKDLGTVPVLASAFPELRAFYPDGAWWTPCLMQNGDGLLATADRHGLDDSFCPVRAMFGAFVSGDRFPIPDLLTCSVGAVCDDFSAIAQRVETLGHRILWWEAPYRRAPAPGEETVKLPGGLLAPASQRDVVRAEMARLRDAFAALAGRPASDALIAEAIRHANAIRQILRDLRNAVFLARRAPLPALELLIAEMLIIHYCSDREATATILADLLAQVHGRVAADAGYGSTADVKVFWVNPTADLRCMTILEDVGARLCGTDFLFTHALDPIPELPDLLDALARTALADPMTGPARERAARIVADMRAFGAEALVVSRIPGASHCAHEGAAIIAHVADALGVPGIEIEIPGRTESFEPTLRTRLEALVETARSRRTIQPHSTNPT